MMKPEEQDILTPEQKKEVTTFAKEQFAFLKNAKGFSRPLVNQPSNGLLIYRNATMGIKIKMSFAFPGYFYDSLTVALGKLDDDGHYPDPYNMVKERIRSYWVLESFLTRQLHIQDEQISALDQLFRDWWGKKRVWTVEQWKEAISAYQPLSQKYIDLILQQPSEVLFPTALEYLPVSYETFAQLAREHFGFLVEHVFQPEPVIGYYGSHTWINAEIGIKIYKDFRDRDVYCAIIKLVDGKVPTTDPRELKQAGFTESTGWSGGIYLENLLSKNLGITDPDLDALRDIPGLLGMRGYSDFDYRYTKTAMSMNASLVKRYLSQIMSAF